jgi:protein-tyrosine phosphatase
MRAIIPAILWIGHAGDARDLKKIMEMGIELLIDVAIEEPPVVLPRDVAYCRFPIHDGDGNSPEMLISAIDAATRFVRGNRRTLVACSAGMSRSPAIAAAVISRLNKIPLDEAIQRVATTGPCDISPRLWADLLKLSSASD